MPLPNLIKATAQLAKDAHYARVAREMNLDAALEQQAIRQAPERAEYLAYVEQAEAEEKDLLIRYRQARQRTRQAEADAFVAIAQLESEATGLRDTGDADRQVAEHQAYSVAAKVEQAEHESALLTREGFPITPVEVCRGWVERGWLGTFERNQWTMAATLLQNASNRKERPS